MATRMENRAAGLPAGVGVLNEHASEYTVAKN